MSESKVLSKSREAWVEFGDEFADIARRFRENYQEISQTATSGTEKSQQSIERAVKAVGKAIDDTANVIVDSLRDPKVREETEEAGSALLNAVGVTLSELGEALQRDAAREQTQAKTT